MATPSLDLDLAFGAVDSNVDLDRTHLLSPLHLSPLPSNVILLLLLLGSPSEIQEFSLSESTFSPVGGCLVISAPQRFSPPLVESMQTQLESHVFTRCAGYRLFVITTLMLSLSSCSFVCDLSCLLSIMMRPANVSIACWSAGDVRLSFGSLCIRCSGWWCVDGLRRVCSCSLQSLLHCLIPQLISCIFLHTFCFFFRNSSDVEFCCCCRCCLDCWFPGTFSDCCCCTHTAQSLKISPLTAAC